MAYTRGYPWPPAGASRGTHLLPRSVARPERAELWLDRIVATMPRYETPALESYLDVLEAALLDRYLSVHETEALVHLAHRLGLGRNNLEEIHRDYVIALAAAALDDGIVTDVERADLDTVAELLGLSALDVDFALSIAQARAPRRPAFALRAGDAVCLTGQMTCPREEVERLAVTRGLVVGGLTRRTRLLVAADPDSLSGKAKKARDYGVPIVTESSFNEMLDRL